MGIDWSPEDHMGFWGYRKFKLGYWARIDRVPRWVWGEFQRDVSQWLKWNPGGLDGKSFVYTGRSLKYKVTVDTGHEAKFGKAWGKIK